MNHSSQNTQNILPVESVFRQISSGRSLYDLAWQEMARTNNWSEDEMRAHQLSETDHRNKLLKNVEINIEDLLLYEPQNGGRFKPRGSLFVHNL